MVKSKDRKKEKINCAEDTSDPTFVQENELKSNKISAISVSDVTKKTKRKKVKQDKTDAETYLDTPVADGENRKKKIKLEACTETAKDSLESTHYKKHKKHKKDKHKTRDHQTIFECDTDMVQFKDNYTNENLRVDKKKKLISDGTSFEVDCNSAEILPQAVFADKPKHKKKHSQKENELDADCSVSEDVAGNKTKLTKHKKRKKSKSKDETELKDESVGNSQGLSAEVIRHKEKKKKHKDKTYVNGEQEDSSEVSVVRDVSGDLSQGLPTEKKKKKRKDRTDANTEDSVVNDGNLPAIIQTNGLQILQTEDTAHKKKKKSKAEKSAENETETFPKVPVSNETSESPTNQTDSSSSAVLGQWQGNLFGSSERQNKFLKLLGGMKKVSANGSQETEKKKGLFSSQGCTKKKGLFGSLTSVTNGSLGGNIALSVSAATILNKQLEDDFNTALSFKLSGNKGAGFGFAKDPAEGKKFHIDINKSSSIKIDD